jgi:hypothetical protein
MISRFADFARSNTPASPTMPIVHTTDWHVFREIMQNRSTLVNHLCPVFHEDLLYFYYAKPTYRMHPDVEPTSLMSYYLVSILFEPTSMGAFHRIFPFDSGAFAQGLYRSNVHPRMKVEDFELQKTIDAVTEAVDVFFGSNANYFKGKPKDGITIRSTDIEAEAYLSIIRTPARTHADDRRAAIEIQINRSLDIRTADILAVILPEDLLDDPIVKNFITNNLNAEPIGYFCPHARPTEDVRAMMIEARRFYKDRALL